MKIPVDRLTDSPASFRFRGDSAWWQSALAPDSGLPDELEDPLEFSCRAHRMGEDLYLEGAVEGAVELECGRWETGCPRIPKGLRLSPATVCSWGTNWRPAGFGATRSTSDPFFSNWYHSRCQ
jgi:hypothetical protein